MNLFLRDHLSDSLENVQCPFLVISVEWSTWKEFANACPVPHGPVPSTQGRAGSMLKAAGRRGRQVFFCRDDSSKRTLRPMGTVLGRNLALLQGIS